LGDEEFSPVGCCTARVVRHECTNILTCSLVLHGPGSCEVLIHIYQTTHHIPDELVLYYLCLIELRNI